MKAASESDVAVVVVGNDPTCGPDMATTGTTRRRTAAAHACLHRASDGREGRDRESIDLAQEQIVKQVFIRIRRPL